jgi:hypothetical protein
MNLLNDSYFLKSFYVLGKERTKCFNCSYCRARNNREDLLYFDKLPTEVNPHLVNIPVVINVLYGDPILYIESTLEYLERLQNARHKGPVIVITKGANSGEVFAGMNGILSPSVTAIRIADDSVMTPRYLYYLMKGYEKRLMPLSKGVSIKSIDSFNIVLNILLSIRNLLL